MKIEEGFSDCETRAPQKTLRSASLALRRDGIKTMEQLQEIYRDHPENLRNIRGIGPKSMAVIGEVLSSCKPRITD